MKFDFDKLKNEILAKERSIDFPQVIETIAEKGILLDIEHPNQKRYPNQFMLVIEYNNYTYCVPYVKDGGICFLKTVFPNRDFMYLLKEIKNEKN
jgi:hypothetical protein